MKANELEDRVITALLSDLPPELEALRSQYEQATVTEREFTGVGFFTSFHVPDTVERLPPGDYSPLEIYLTVQNVPYGALAMLFIRDDVISFLEVITMWGDWPDNPVLLDVG